ncbi:hypothetical protein [Deinococcus sp. NW-56]|uniref:hypothetical protein n=1 Tax=Deinococcus sp. NW-56 TaxID=2080419 RepID=UPI000CF37CC4|nr:hypothetical protein [Deinococcus sp. NW-56]
MPSNNTGLSLDRLAVRVTLRLLQSPGTYTARSLARELGETPNRVTRVVHALEEEVGVQRDGPNGPLTVQFPALQGGD